MVYDVRISHSSRTAVCLPTFVVMIIVWWQCDVKAAQDWPQLPLSNGAVEIPVQEWPMRPGSRTARILIHYPHGELRHINPQTGILLTLHNWGGIDCVGTASPEVLANRYNLISVCVNYLQSGPKDSIDGPEPYDFGYLQALDSLRALWYVRDQLNLQKIQWHDGRLFCTGGSGGGNVCLMANKLAPRTFTAVIDLCGMKKLSDDIAFNLDGGSSLNARYTLTPSHPNALSLADQELRFIGNPEHLAMLKQLDSRSLIISVHGTDDDVCPFRDAVEFSANVRKAGLAIEEHWITANDIDGTVFTSTGHGLGNRTEIVSRVAGQYLDPQSDQALIRSTPTDFDLKEELLFPCTGGRFLISYRTGFPVGRFESEQQPPHYSDHHQLLIVQDAAGHQRAIESPADWAIRRSHIKQHFQRAAGPLPGPAQRVTLNPETHEERFINSHSTPTAPESPDAICMRRISFQSGEQWRVSAWLLFPARLRDEMSRPESQADPQSSKFPAVLCLQQTTEHGKNEPAGLAGDADLHYGLELASRGYITLCPDYPTFGDYQIDLTQPSRIESGTARAIWDNIRAIDYLETLPVVDQDRIGCIGHSLGGHNAIFTALFEERIRALAVSCGFTSLAEDDLPSWTGPRYMPKIATEFQNRIDLLPFDFHELIASLAPRPVFAFAAEHDDDFAVSGVRDVMRSARQVYEIHNAAESLVERYEPIPHSFSVSARNAAYEFFEKHMARPDSSSVYNSSGNDSVSSSRRRRMALR